jgi:hypothetical protein
MTQEYIIRFMDDIKSLKSIELPQIAGPGPEYFAMPGRDRNTRLFLFLHDAIKSVPAVGKIKSVLEADQRVQKLISNGLVATGGGSGSRLELDTLVAWFVNYATNHNITDATEKLEEYLAAKEVGYLAVIWVVGLEVESTIKLTDTVDLVPISLMPDNSDREYFEQHEFNFLNSGVVKPKAALVARSSTSKVLANDPAKESKKNGEKIRSTFESLYDNALLLNLLPGLACIANYSTSYLEGSVPPGPFGGMGGSRPLQDIAGTHKMTKATTGMITKHKYDEFLKSFSSLKGIELERWRLIISRLSQAKRRWEIADKVLDLGIAMEMALINDTGHREQLSLTFRLRGARILTKDASKRKKIYNDLKDIYDYRSKVAHNGAISQQDRERLKSNIDRYEILASNICSTILLKGKNLDWENILLS